MTHRLVAVEVSVVELCGRLLALRITVLALPVALWSHEIRAFFTECGWLALRVDAAVISLVVPLHRRLLSRGVS